MQINQKDIQYTDLSSFDASGYKAGPKWKVFLWYPFNYYFLHSTIPWPYRLKRMVLRAFGAKIGKGVVVKTRVRVKNPWRLCIGDYCWIGEDVWIDNLENVHIGSNVCISQGALLLTGNHDYTTSSFSYRLGKIRIEDGVWIGARSTVCPGVTCRAHSILTVDSVATKNLEWGKVYAGNPAQIVRERYKNTNAVKLSVVRDMKNG
jgi:putative colanic acid biosynthesis acetyltransferase WcaF